MYTSLGRSGDFVTFTGLEAPPVYVLATDWLVYGRPCLLRDGYTVRVRGEHYHVWALQEVSDRKSLERSWLPWWAIAERIRRYKARKRIEATNPAREALKALPMPPRPSKR